MALEFVRQRILAYVARTGPATWACALVLLISQSGCTSRSAVSQLRDGAPPESAAKVMELYDGDRDGKLVAAELARSPGLVDGLARIDVNKDGVVDLAEMTARFSQLDELSDVVAMQVMVTANGTPLDGAIVTMTPDPCMGEGKQAYEGTTAGGIVAPMGAVNPMPTPTGFYTVHIVHAPTNVDVTRGHEVADDRPSPNRLTIEVSGKNPPAARSR